MNKNILADDLNYILKHTHSVWDEFKNKNIFITGGTGFFGTWLLETFAWANQYFNLNLSVVVLTRDPAAYAKKVPHITSQSMFHFHVGDVCDFIFPPGIFSHVIHAATESSATLNAEHPDIMYRTIVQGTQNTLRCAQHMQAQKFLFVSSGAVYGKQPPEVSHLVEDFSGKPDEFDKQAAYANGKYIAEQMCHQYAKGFHGQIKLARCFAFVGPYLPIDRHFAIGNFIRDAMMQKTIHINGDGTPFRSYQYAADLVIWLLQILSRGQALVPYNVGSEEAISIFDLAECVASCVDPNPKVQVAKTPDKSKLPERYVPSVQKAKAELGLENQISLTQAIQKTIEWYKTKEST